MNDIDKIISQLEQQRAAIDNAISALRTVSGTSSQPEPSQPAQKRRGRPPRRLSADGRKRISEAARKMWAAKKTSSSDTARSPRKGGITAAGRKRLAEAMKRRWAERKAAAKKSPSKKAASKTAAIAG